MKKISLSDNTRVWFHGLASAFIGSAAGSMGPVLVAPAVFNFDTLLGVRHVVLSSIFAGAATALAYLKASPLPPMTTTKTSNTVSDGNVIATSTTEKTTQG